MEPLRFIFVPLGSAGDVNPLVWLARLMADRGHDTVMVIQSRMADHARRARLRVITAGSADQHDLVLRDPNLWHPLRAFGVLARQFPLWTEEMLPAIRGELVPGRTVLVGAGIAFAARIVAEAQKVPLVTVQLQPTIFMSPNDAPVLGRGFERLKDAPFWLRRLVFKLAHLETDRHLRKPINRIRAKQGLQAPVREILHRWALSPDRVFALFPDWFGPRQPDWPAQTIHARFPMHDEAEARPVTPELEAFLRAGPPPVLLTPGSANMHAKLFFEAGIQASQLVRRRALLITPFAEHAPAALPPGAARFDFAPFSKVFARCAAVIHHGGVGTCAQGMAAGVPQLIMAMAHDQPDNGWRLRRLGVGDYLYPGQFKAKTVADRLKSLLEADTVADACLKTQALMKNQISPEEVAGLLETFAERTLPIAADMRRL
jgi:UDP:flavonoid glycosyltransferase YjiC (YdhE family)